VALDSIEFDPWALVTICDPWALVTICERDGVDDNAETQQNTENESEDGGQTDTQQNTAGDSDDASETAGGKSNGAGDADNSATKLMDLWFDRRALMVEKMDEMKELGNSKVLPIAKQDKDEIALQNLKALRASPQSSPEEFLQQIELFEQLRRLFEDKLLTKNAIIFFCASLVSTAGACLPILEAK
jgi:hypothetical protein